MLPNLPLLQILRILPVPPILSNLPVPPRIPSHRRRESAAVAGSGSRRCFPPSLSAPSVPNPPPAPARPLFTTTPRLTSFSSSTLDLLAGDPMPAAMAPYTMSTSKGSWLFPSAFPPTPSPWTRSSPPSSPLSPALPNPTSSSSATTSSPGGAPEFLQTQTQRQIEEKFISLVQSCRNLEKLHQIQAQIITHGFFQSPFLAPKITIAFFQFQKPNLALQSFQQIQQPNVVLWNVMFKGCTGIELHAETLGLFVCMRRRDVRPNEYTFTFVIKSCARTLRWREGEELHCFAVKTGYESNGFVATTLMDMYSSVGLIDSARKVFCEMPERNVVAWTSMVSAYISLGDLEMARVVFEWANVRDAILWNTMISGYIEGGNMEAARELFDRMPVDDRDVMTWNTILLGYSNIGDIEACESLFEEMPEKNLFSWNGLIGGYMRRGWFHKVFCVFDRMLRSPGIMLNDATLVTVLSACAKLGAVNIGRWIHVCAVTSGFRENLYVGNGLIDMYSKCGCIMDAMLIFGRMENRDVVTMNATIGGLATHGRGLEALELFEQMLQKGERPDGITFVCALSACVHAGMVEKGYSYFRLMMDDHLITPWIEHYGCMVDLLGKAGLLNEAIEFTRRMPMKPDSVIWSALLRVCQIHNDVHLAKLVMNKIIKLEPKDVTNYVVLSNVYGAAGMWKEVAGLKCLTRSSGNAKLPGCSFVEIGFQVVEFYSFDERHCKTSEIYQVLHGLKELLKLAGCEQDVYEAYE